MHWSTPAKGSMRGPKLLGKSIATTHASSSPQGNLRGSGTFRIRAQRQRIMLQVEKTSRDIRLDKFPLLGLGYTDLLISFTDFQSRELISAILHRNSVNDINKLGIDTLLEAGPRNMGKLYAFCLQGYLTDTIPLLKQCGIRHILQRLRSIVL